LRNDGKRVVCIMLAIVLFPTPHVWCHTLYDVFQRVRLLPATLSEYLPECVLELLCAALQQRAQLGNCTLIRAEVGALKILQSGAGAVERGYVLAELDVSQTTFDDAVLLVRVLEGCPQFVDCIQDPVNVLTMLLASA
jgi:hypothetical protein